MANNNMELPAGLTMDMLQKIAQFFSQEQSEQTNKPSGTLPANQIRGVKPGYKYKFREYPKALNPPGLKVEGEAEERTLRARWGTPLPWQDRESIAAYYSMVVYPKVMYPPQVIVGNQAEEDAMLASWSMSGGTRAVYPRWVFSADSPAQMVHSREDEIALGDGWYSTPAEAQAAASNAPATGDASTTNERDQLLDRAKQLGVPHNASWGTERLRKAVTKAEEESLQAA